MNLQKAERLTHMLERLIKIQNQSRTSSMYEMETLITETTKQAKLALLEEPSSLVSDEPFHQF